MEKTYIVTLADGTTSTVSASSPEAARSLELEGRDVVAVEELTEFPAWLHSRIWAAALLILSLAGVGLAGNKARPFSKYPLEPKTLELAISVGARFAGDSTALSLKDSAQGFMAAMNQSAGTTSGTSTGFSLEVYTPFSWVAQLSSWKSKKYLELAAEDLDENATAGVLRVYANPDRPRYVSRSGLVGTSGVDHVVIRSTNKKGFEILQPTEILEDSTYTQNALGAGVEFSALVALFDLEEVKRIAALDKKGEFYILVIGETGEEKKFKVKTKHFDRLP